MIYNRGFALPTVLISSIIMMMVLLSGLTALASVNTSIRTQYSESITDQAAESGLAYARGCIAQNGNTITWSNAQPLRPNTDCNGVAATGCPNTSTDNACYVLNGTNYRTSFEVGVITDGSNNPIGMNSKGIYNAMGSSGGVVTKVSSSSVKAWATNISSSIIKTKILTMSAVTYGDSAYPSNSGHACAIADAQLYCWGENGRGQVGDGTNNNRQGPTLVTALAGKTVTAVKVASNFGEGYNNTSQGSTCAIADAQLYCWGDKGYPGGNHSTTPALFNELSGKKVGGQSGVGQNPTELKLKLY